MRLFLGNFRLFLSRFISVCTISQALVISVAQSILLSAHLHRRSISISRLKWPVKTDQQSVDLVEKKKMQSQSKGLLWDFTQATESKFILKLWSGSWENILKKECNPQIMGLPRGWDTERVVDPSRKSVDWWAGVTLVYPVIILLRGLDIGTGRKA